MLSVTMVLVLVVNCLVISHRYRMCVRVYLHGDGTGKGTHISLFFVLMSGEHDALLQWPFRRNVTVTLIGDSLCTQ